MKWIRDKYDQWCKETKRNGSVLVGGSVYEFFDWLASLPSSSVTGEEVRRNIVLEIKSAICDDEKSEADIAYSICIRIINKHFESIPVTGESEGERKFTLKECPHCQISPVMCKCCGEVISDHPMN